MNALHAEEDLSLCLPRVQRVLLGRLDPNRRAQRAQVSLGRPPGGVQPGRNQHGWEHNRSIN